MATPIIGLLDPTAGALAAVASFVGQFVGDRRRGEKAEALRQGLRDGYGELKGRLAEVEAKAVGPHAEEAFVVAVRQALGSARLDKARRFGRVLGATLAGGTPNWQEAAEFIRNLEEFSDADFDALKTLWRVQQKFYRFRNLSDATLEMSTDANDYTNTWTGVLDHATRAGFSKDDWYARCGRLSGFGLVAQVPSSVGPDALCYRLTGRAVRLLGLLGRSTNPGEYPKVKYHATKEPVTVDDEDEESALGDGWAESPDAFK